MRRAFPIVVLIAILILFLSLRALIFDPPESSHELTGPVQSPAPTAPVLAQAPTPLPQVKPAPKHRPPVKALRARSQSDDTESTEQLLEKAGKHVLKESKPELSAESDKRAETKSSKWLPKNRRHARFNSQIKGEPISDLCDTEACQKSQDGYTLVGVVVSTSPTRAHNKHFTGDFEQGDAKRKPFVHLK